MSSFYIKALAMSFMLVDHIGLFIYPEITALRVIGRLSFPLFAWLIANGAYYSRNINMYAYRLLIFALISQIPYLLLYRTTIPDFIGLNIFFTLLAGLLAIIILKHTTDTTTKYLTIITTALIAQIIGADYGVMGALSIVFFHLYFNNLKMMFISQTLIYSLLSWLPLLYTPLPLIAVLQPIAVLAIIFISQYNSTPGPKLKFIFYPFYPVHLLVLYFIKL